MGLPACRYAPGIRMTLDGYVTFSATIMRVQAHALEAKPSASLDTAGDDTNNLKWAQRVSRLGQVRNSGHSRVLAGIWLS